MSAIEISIAKGFHVEVDIISKDNNEVCLGHDEPKYQIPTYLWSQTQYSNKIIWHAKDFNAMNWALQNGLHCFAHKDDHFVLTSERRIWTCDLNLTGMNTIIMSNEVPVFEVLPFGLCTDHPCRAKDFQDYKY